MDDDLADDDCDDDGDDGDGGSRRCMCDRAKVCVHECNI